MNKMLKVKEILNLSVAIFIIVWSLIMLIFSCDIYSDEYGTDISFNSDYIVIFLIGIITLGYSVFYNHLNNNNIYQICMLIGTFIVSSYSLGVFLKALNKALIKKVSFDFINNQMYLYIGVTCLLMFLYYLVDYLIIKKGNEIKAK